MSKQALQNIAGEVQAIVQKSDVSTKRIVENNTDINAHKDDVISIVKDTTKCLGDLVNLIMADAYFYKVVTEAKLPQVKEYLM